jgi:3-oxoacyl-[acyl-carrier protein] reductase
LPSFPRRIHETTEEDWDLMFDLNLRYVARAVRAALRRFLEQGKGGTIVGVGSITGVAGSPEQSAYGAAKAGLASLARSIAAEYSGDGIRMNVVACGPIATPVAEAVVFLASPLSSCITGQSLVVEGGATAIGPFPLR